MFWKGFAAFVAVLAFSNVLPGYSLAAGVASPPVSSAIRSDGLRAYVPDTNALTVKVFDISNPSSSSLLGTISLVSAPRSITLVESVGTTALLITRTASPLPKIEIYDGSGSGVPAYSSEFTLPSGFGAQMPAGMVAFTASDGSQKLCVLDEAPGNLTGGRAYIYGINGSAVSASSYNYEGVVMVGSGSGVTLHSVAADQSAGSNRGLLYATNRRSNGALYRIDPVLRTATSLVTDLGLPTHVGVTSDGNLVMVRVSEENADVRVYNALLNMEQTNLRINVGGNRSVYVSPTGVSYPYEGLWVDRGVLYITKYKKIGFAPGGDNKVRLSKYAAYRDRSSNDNYNWSVSGGDDVAASWAPSSSGPPDSLVYTSGTNARPINENRLWWARSSGGAFRPRAMIDALAPTVVRSVSPASGEVGSSVTITGFNFTFDRLRQRVRFAPPSNRAAGTRATVTSSTPTQLVVTIPSVSAGMYEVFVEHEDAGGNLFDSVRFNVVVTAPAPTVTRILPVSGNRGVSVLVTISGTGFYDGVTAQLTRTGQSPIDMTEVRLDSPTSIRARIPIPADAVTGAWNVVVMNADGQSGMLPDGFTVVSPLPAPTVIAILPNSGAQGASVPVTITGTNFVSGASAQLTRTGESAIPLTVESVSPDELQITASVEIPAAASVGTWNVFVANPDGQSAMLADGFTITAVEPVVNEGVVRAGDLVGDGIVLTWGTNPPGAGVDIYAISGTTDVDVFTTDPAAWGAPIAVNNTSGSFTDSNQVGQGTQKYYKIVPTGVALTAADLQDDVIGKFDLRVAPSDMEPENLFISIPFLIPDTTVASVFGSQATEGDFIVQHDVLYNPVRGTQFLSGVWSPLDLGGGPLPLITNIDPGTGYAYARVGDPFFVTAVGMVRSGSFARSLRGGLDPINFVPQYAEWIGNPYPVSVPIESAGFGGASVGSNLLDAGAVQQIDANASPIGGTEFGTALNTGMGWRRIEGDIPSQLRIRPGRGFMFTEPILETYNWTLSRPY